MSEELSKLAEEALADDAKATPGPWGFQFDEYGRTQDICTIVDGEEVEAIVITDSGVYPPRPPDAQFIASARTREPLLAAGLLASLAECAALRGKLAEEERTARDEVADLLAERHAICDALQIDNDEDAANPAAVAMRLLRGFIDLEERRLADIKERNAVVLGLHERITMRGDLIAELRAEVSRLSVELALVKGER